jgi:glutathione S-transferase
MLELYQAEWCPHSHTVRQRMTELGVDFIARQVPAKPKDRDELERLAGTREIPVLVTGKGEVIAEEDAILDFLDRHGRERSDAGVHREKVEQKAHFE